MVSVGVVTVNMLASETSLCSATGTTTQITFRQNSGDLPELVVLSTLTSTGGSPVITVSTATQGTKEDAVCNNRGLCDSDTGLCTCYLAWTSSNGQGAVGTLGDCGVRSGVVLYDYMLITCLCKCCRGVWRATPVDASLLCCSVMQRPRLL
jgi:hypothetical protein